MTLKDKIILDLCGGTGAWSKPYKEAGYDVRLITLPEHDVRLYKPPENVYGILAAPPCTEFSSAKRFHGTGNYTYNILLGLEVVSACCRIILACYPEFWCIENPGRGTLGKWVGKPIFTFSPWQYGDSYQKETSLWGRCAIPVITVSKKPAGLKKFSMLRSKEISPAYYGKLPRQVRRSITPPGFAKAFFKANP